MNEWLAKTPFDIYELHLFSLVAQHRSFTRAAKAAGLTQSALTRQIKTLENALGLVLFERSTRHVHVTPAGELLLTNSALILRTVSSTLDALHDHAGFVPKILRVGISKSIGLSYLPGFFVRFRKQCPEIQINVSHDTSNQIISRLETEDLDVAIVTLPRAVPRSLDIAHVFRDDFALITSQAQDLRSDISRVRPKDLAKLALGNSWLTISPTSLTGRQLNAWLKSRGLEIEPAMEMDNFDVIINLVALGLGMALVPKRSLPLYLQRRTLRKIPLRPTFSRTIAVLVRKTASKRPHIAKFLEALLF
jgi:DNA-binding transcriptional LysR family regulator